MNIKLNNIESRGNDFCIRFGRLFVTICTYTYSGIISCVMNVMDEENNKTFFFDTIEEAFRYAQEEVSKCHNVEEVLNNYEEYTKKVKQKRKK